MFRKKRGHVTFNLTDDETAILRRLVTEYQALLDQPAPGDPVLARLFPSANNDDNEVADTFRELTFEDLDAHKRLAAEIVMSSVDEQGPAQGTLNDEQCEAWVVLLTDLRLSLGTRIGVTQEMMDGPFDPNDEAHWSLSLLHYLGALQETLVAALTD